MEFFVYNLFIVSLAGVYVLFWILSTEYLSRSNRLSKSDARKLLHIVSGNLIFLVPFFGDKFIATIIPLLFIPINYLLSPNSPIKKFKLETFDAGHTWGTVYYSISLTLVVYFGYDNPWLIITSFLPLSIGDGFAAVVGSRAKSFRRVFGGEKSLIGSWTLVLTTFVSVAIGLSFLKLMNISILSIEFIILTSFSVAILSAIVEYFSPKGTDNLFIPLINLFVFIKIEQTLINASMNIDPFYFSVGALFALLFGIIVTFITIKIF